MGRSDGKGPRPLAPNAFVVLSRHFCKDRQDHGKVLNTISHQGNDDPTHGEMTPLTHRMAAVHMGSRVERPEPQSTAAGLGSGAAAVASSGSSSKG